MDALPLYPNEPPVGGWSDLAVFDVFLRWAVAQGASDIKLTPTSPVMLAVSGEWWPVTRRPANASETAVLVDKASRRPEASARAEGGQPENFSHEVMNIANDRRSGSIRFRANATACMVGNSVGLSLTLRVIPGEIPFLSKLGVSPELEPHLYPEHGLVSIAGVMGSGKTTTMAGIMREIRTRTRPFDHDAGKPG